MIEAKVDLENKYDILEFIDKGRSGKVYKGMNKNEELVAIKVKLFQLKYLVNRYRRF
jgi:hypothetical protein